MLFFSNKKIRLGVSGLSRSGKTVFLTSLVHQLLRDKDMAESIESINNKKRTLPFLDAINQERLLSVSLDPNPHKFLPNFRYERFSRSLLSNEPKWPESTDDISFLRLVFDFYSKNGLYRTVFGSNRLYLEVIDYPGEWLLDLPLLNLSFSEWSNQMLILFEEDYRKERAIEWLSILKTINEKTTFDKDRIAKLVKQFRHTLRALKYDGFSFLQPGRFVMPGDLSDDSNLLMFCPLPSKNEEFRQSEIYLTMQKNYQDYKQKLVTPFYENFMAKLDRQIILVDLLENLNRGYNHFNDTQEALKTILKHFRYGKKRFFDFLAPNVDKVLFAVTKLDHVGPMQASSCKLLLEELLADSIKVLGLNEVSFKTEAISALVSAHFKEIENSGKIFQKVSGIEGNELLFTYPGEVPSSIPSGEEWLKIEEAKKRGESFCFPKFNPPILQSRQLPHIHLDKVMQFLLGEELL